MWAPVASPTGGGGTQIVQNLCVWVRSQCPFLCDGNFYKPISRPIILIILCYAHERSCGLQGQTFPRFLCVRLCRWVLSSQGRGQCVIAVVELLSCTPVVTLRGGAQGVSFTVKMQSVMKVGITQRCLGGCPKQCALTGNEWLKNFHATDTALNQRP